MKISVVMVCLNSERTVRFALESFQRQCHANKELLIIDGGSTDRTVEFVRQAGCPDVRIISEADDGLFDAMNKGLRLYSGDAVGFLNSDDTFHDNHALDRISEALKEADVAYGDLVIVNDHLRKRTVRMWKTGPLRRGSFRWGWSPPHPTFYVTRHVIDTIGHFDCRYRRAADYDFMLRVLALNDFRISYIPHTLIDFGFGGQSTATMRSIVEANLECLRSRREHFGPRLLDLALLLKPMRKVLQLRL